MSENSKIGGWNWERDLSESGVEGFNVDNGVLLVVKPESAQQTVNLDIWVGGPDADVITVLVIDTGTRDFSRWKSRGTGFRRRRYLLTVSEPGRRVHLQGVRQ